MSGGENKTGDGAGVWPWRSRASTWLACVWRCESRRSDATSLLRRRADQTRRWGVQTARWGAFFWGASLLSTHRCCFVRAGTRAEGWLAAETLSHAVASRRWGCPRCLVPRLDAGPGAGYSRREGDGGARWEEWRASNMPETCESVVVAGSRQAS